MVCGVDRRIASRIELLKRSPQGFNSGMTFDAPLDAAVFFEALSER